MDLKKFLKQFVVAFLGVNTAIALFNAAVFPSSISYFLMVTGLIALLLTLTDNVVKFFTIPQNFLTKLIAGTILTLLGVFLAGYVANEVLFNEISFESLDLGLFVLKKFTLNNVASMILFSILTAAIIEIFYEVDKK